MNSGEPSSSSQFHASHYPMPAHIPTAYLIKSTLRLRNLCRASPFNNPLLNKARSISCPTTLLSTPYWPSKSRSFLPRSASWRSKSAMRSLSEAGTSSGLTSLFKALISSFCFCKSAFCCIKGCISPPKASFSEASSSLTKRWSVLTTKLNWSPILP